MPKREEILSGLQQDSEKLIEELELMLAKQEIQLKEMHAHPVLPAATARAGNALIRETEVLLQTLTSTLERQKQELKALGIDVDRGVITGNPEADKALLEEAARKVEEKHAHIKYKVSNMLRQGKPSTVPVAKKRRQII